MHWIQHLRDKDNSSHWCNNAASAVMVYTQLKLMQSNTSVLHDGFTVILSFHFNLMIILEAVFLSAYNIVIFLRGQKLFLATFIHACVCVWCMHAGKRGKVECRRHFRLLPAGDLKVMQTRRWACSRCQARAPKRGDERSTREEAVNVRLDVRRQTPSDLPLLPDSGCTLNSLGRFKLLILKFLLRHDSHNHTPYFPPPHTSGSQAD